MTKASIHRAMWLCIGILFLSYGALVAQEVVAVQEIAKATPSMYELLADKVPGLLTLVFLVVWFFRHLDKKNDIDLARAKEYKESMMNVVNTHAKAMDGVTTALGKLEDRVSQLAFKTPR